MDKLIKESVQLTFEKEGYQLPEDRKNLGWRWSYPSWHVTLSGKTEKGELLIYKEDDEKLFKAVQDLRETIATLYKNIKITLRTLETTNEGGVLIEDLIKRNNWYVIFLDYLDKEDD